MQYWVIDYLRNKFLPNMTGLLAVFYKILKKLIRYSDILIVFFRSTIPDRFKFDVFHLLINVQYYKHVDPHIAPSVRTLALIVPLL